MTSLARPAAGLLAMLALAACSGGSGGPAATKALDTSRLRAGTCQAQAAPLSTVHRLSGDLTSGRTTPKEARAALTGAQTALLKATPETDLAAPLTGLTNAIGYLRAGIDSSADPKVSSAALATALKPVEALCLGAGSPTANR